MRFGGVEADLGEFEGEIAQRLDGLQKDGFGERLWNKDPTLWKKDGGERAGIVNALGWLDAPRKMRAHAGELAALAGGLKSAGFRHVLHMGMGGSSLAPLVFCRTFGPGAEGLPLTVLDSTDPAVILRTARNLPLAETFFIEASKSGTTAESRAFGEFFYHQIEAAKGAQAGENCAVITDPGSMLAGLADERKYRRTFLNFSDIGGRYSALSFFGLVPAALLGMGTGEMLDRAASVMEACGPQVPLRENPGVALGVIMGALALRGRDKLTFLMPGPIASFGMWVEQLIAESTGKEDKGIVPITGEPPGDPGLYGDDRLFVVFRLENEPDAAVEAAAGALAKAGHPVVTVSLKDRMDLAGQFFLWEIATATAGAVLGINPFDQPNVEEAKQLTRKILEEVRKEGGLAEGKLELTEGPLQLYLAGGAASVPQAFSFFFQQAAAHDYVAILAYLPESEEADGKLQSLRTLIRDRLRVATAFEYGPRYLHSTGQLYKGGPNSGLFLLLTADHPEDAPNPGQPYTFGTLIRSQALGDFEAMRKRRRRVLRVHLAGRIDEALSALGAMVERVLAGK